MAMQWDSSERALKERVARHARDLGFDEVRIASAEPFGEEGMAAQERVRSGFMEGMPWFTQERVQMACDPQSLLPGARSVIAMALSYLPTEEEAPKAGAMVGKVARYAQWVDYHQVMKEKLRILSAELPHLAGRPVRSRVFVDDSPLLERAAARRAGLGWFGKNTNILTSTHGSWVFLGALITDLEMEPDEPLKKSCGECIRCIPACPTGAIVAPYVIDARRCISYLTIECRGSIPRHLRLLVDDWVFGCDVCQEVCPANSGVAAATMPVLKRAGFSALELVPLLSMTQQEFSSRFRHRPIKRAKMVGLKRNACVALGNIADPRAVPALGKALKDGQPLVRGHAGWALGRIGGPDAIRLLEQALEGEAFAGVREEIEAALAETQARGQYMETAEIAPIR
ncbi:MAG: tRNA epoxyqueuosine(34) reductase QueG [Chloroflexota bacterium]